MFHYPKISLSYFCLPINSDTGVCTVYHYNICWRAFYKYSTISLHAPIHYNDYIVAGANILLILFWFLLQLNFLSLWFAMFLIWIWILYIHIISALFQRIPFPQYKCIFTFFFTNIIFTLIKLFQSIFCKEHTHRDNSIH